MMKKFILLCLLMTAVQSFAQKDPIVMEIDGKPVTKSEFLQIYLKNNPDPKFDKASLDEYVEMFTKFKSGKKLLSGLIYPLWMCTQDCDS